MIEASHFSKFALALLWWYRFYSGTLYKKLDVVLIIVELLLHNFSSHFMLVPSKRCLDNTAFFNSYSSEKIERISTEKPSENAIFFFLIVVPSEIKYQRSNFRWKVQPWRDFPFKTSCCVPRLFKGYQVAKKKCVTLIALQWQKTLSMLSTRYDNAILHLRNRKLVGRKSFFTLSTTRKNWTRRNVEYNINARSGTVDITTTAALITR